MNDKEKEAIDVLENVVIFKNTSDRFTQLDLNSINTLLKFIENQKTEIEALNILNENYKNNISEITSLKNYAEAEIEKKDKQIDLMANNLIGVVFSNNDNKEILFDNKEDVKQYFEKKAEEDK